MYIVQELFASPANSSLIGIIITTSWLIADINKVCSHVFVSQKYMFSKFSAVHSFLFISLYLIRMSWLKCAIFYEYFKNKP